MIISLDTLSCHERSRHVDVSYGFFTVLPLGGGNSRMILRFFFCEGCGLGLWGRGCVTSEVDRLDLSEIRFGGIG